MVDVIKKKSFAALVDEKAVEKHNSDLSNLAHAMQYARATEQEAQDLQKRIAALATRIESVEVVGVDEVHTIYGEAQGHGHSPRKRL